MTLAPREQSRRAGPIHAGGGAVPARHRPDAHPHGAQPGDATALGRVTHEHVPAVAPERACRPAGGEPLPGRGLAHVQCFGIDEQRAKRLQVVQRAPEEDRDDVRALVRGGEDVVLRELAALLDLEDASTLVGPPLDYRT